MRWIAPVLSMIAPTLAMAQTAPATPPQVKPEDKKICHFESETGSNLHTKVCRTKAEWAAIAAVDERNTQNFQNHRMNNLPTTAQ